jgi:hypothetical protein
VEAKVLFRIHRTPLARIAIDSQRVTLDVDDVTEQRARYVFEPLQAVRVVTADCANHTIKTVVNPGTIVELFDSEWIGDLKRNLSSTDESAMFLETARHFAAHLQDEYLEVIAWQIDPAPVEL